MWPFNRKKKIDSTEKTVEKQPVEIINFVVKTIHKDRIGTILPKIMSIEKSVVYKSYKTMKDDWKKSAATSDGWFGEISASGPKDRLLAKAKKIANAGGTIIVTSEHKLELPPPNKWWVSRYVIFSGPKPPMVEPKTEEKPVEVKEEPVKAKEDKATSPDPEVKTEEKVSPDSETKESTEVKSEETIKTEDVK